MLLNEGERAARLRADLPYFAEHCLELRPKTASLAPFLFNPAQLELHRRIEEQKAKTGRVRVIILKARQLGISTYVSARWWVGPIRVRKGSKCQFGLDAQHCADP